MRSGFLLWEGQTVPDGDELARLPIVLQTARDVDLYVDHGVEGQPFLMSVLSPTRGKLAFKNYGELVARGVVRKDLRRVSGDDERLIYSSWPHVVEDIGSDYLRACFEFTHQAASKRRRRWRRPRHL